jgi:hypothetical protein
MRLPSGRIREALLRPLIDRLDEKSAVGLSIFEIRKQKR